ncbi:hypothetical protein J6590_043237, partial [Homalodisca vitripennis]
IVKTYAAISKPMIQLAYDTIVQYLPLGTQVNHRQAWLIFGCVPAEPSWLFKSYPRSKEEDIMFLGGAI